MNLKLVRKERRIDGIFSELLDEQGNHIAVTLEHAYDDGNGGYAPKIPNGTFACIRGSHRLRGMDHDFETFEVTGVVGHSNLLFHSGNFNENSSGCILLGDKEVDSNGVEMITNSRVTFQKFLDLETGLNQFELTVAG